MINLSELKPYRRSTKRRKTVGRGVGSGHGTFSGRGAKGQLARSGASMPIGFEGGRMPLHRQIPKRRGFTSKNVKALAISLDILEAKFAAGETVNPKTLFNKGMCNDTNTKIKILATGELKKALKFEKVLVSEAAKEKIQKVGGSIA